jgi:hypothetical protein
MNGRWLCVIAGLAGCTSIELLDPEDPPEAPVEDPDCDRFTVYADADGDGVGDDSRARSACAARLGEVRIGGDCDDSDASVHPGADEHCDGVDEDCDGRVDNGAVDAPDWYVDSDADGHGALRLARSCTPIPGMSRLGGDCDDHDASVHPGAVDAPCDHVDADCDGSFGGPVVVGAVDYGTIQSGIDHAPSGGTVLVCPGTYAESLTLSRSVRVEGYTGHASDVVVEPPSGQALVGGAAAIELVGLTFRGGTTADNGGNVALSSQDLWVDRCAFEDGWAGYEGGGLAWSGGGVAPRIEVRNSRFVGNYADYAGGGLETTSWDAYTVELVDVRFDGNSAGYEGGGGSFSTLDRDAPDSGFMRFERVTAVDNEAGYSGGGIAIGGWRLNEVEIRDSLFERNFADYEGGGLEISGWSPTTARIIGTRFVANESGQGVGLALGSWSDDTLLLDTTVFEDHTCADRCAVAAIGGWGGADVTIVESRFSRNAGGVAIAGRGTTYSVDVSDTVFEDTGSGAALSVMGDGTFRGGVVRRNAAGLGVRGDLTLDKVDLSSGSDDNVDYDLRSPGAPTWFPGVTSLTCSSGVCTP